VVNPDTWEMTPIIELENGQSPDRMYWSGESDLFYIVLYDDASYSICGFTSAGIITPCMEINLAEKFAAFGRSLSLPLHTTPSTIKAIIEDSAGRLEVISIDSTTGNTIDEQIIPTNSDEDINAFWSPDGTQLVYQTSTEPHPVYLLDLETSTVTLVKGGSGLGCIAWSQDGSQFAIFDEELRLFDESGVMVDNFPVTFEGEIRQGCNMAWANHSRRIAFWDVYAEFQTVGLFVVDFDTRETQLIARYAYPTDSITWSLDDQYIAASASFGGYSEIVILTLGGWERWYRLYIYPLGNPVWAVD
jgi:WD40 repeat protein